MQSRIHSVLEALANTVSGFILSYVTAMIFYAAAGLQVSHSQNMGLVGILTIVSILRSYIWRRIFNSRVDRRN